MSVRLLGEGYQIPFQRNRSAREQPSDQTTTDRPATCRYSTSSQTAFASMTLFATTGGTSHTSAVPVQAGGVYRYFIRCQGALGELSDAGNVQFSVEPVRRHSVARRGQRR